MVKTPYSVYQENQVKTAQDGQLILMLYDGAIKSLEQAKIKLKEGDYAAKDKLTCKAQDIISELLCSLNMEAGEIARCLQSIYDYVLRRILHASIHRDLKAFDEVIKLLKELEDAWKKIILKPAKELAAFRAYDDRTRPAQAGVVG
ncbi:MAG: flagellar export chaperone FliS [Pseudomonadota bacterium]